MSDQLATSLALVKHEFYTSSLANIWARKILSPYLLWYT